MRATNLLVLGGMADFNYAFSNCMETTLELSCCKYPDSSQLAREWNDNWQSILGYMEQVILIAPTVGGFFLALRLDLDLSPSKNFTYYYQ